MGGAFAVAATRGGPTAEAAAAAAKPVASRPLPTPQLAGLAGFQPVKLPGKLTLKPLVIHPRQIVVVAPRRVVVRPTSSRGTQKKTATWGSGSAWSASGKSTGSGGSAPPPPPPPPPSGGKKVTPPPPPPPPASPTP